MSFFDGKNRIVVTCARGVSPYLKEELIALGFPILNEESTGIETEGTIDDVMKLNLHIRTGQRVLFLVHRFVAEGPEDLYRVISGIPWEDFISEKSYLCITSFVDTPTINDNRFANLKCKDAIVDRFYEELGRRPDSGPERKGVVIHLHWVGRRGLLFFDTSGEPLSRRGYRKIPLKAPMQETLAAAVVLATGWAGRGNFINPMCGSGTLAIEAALMGLGRAPGLLRNHFGFMHLKGYNENLWKALRNEARRAAKKGLMGRIIATDISGEAVRAARQNAMTAGVEQVLECKVCDYADTPIPEGGGVLVLNPPYGERLGEGSELEKMYRGIGDFFKKKCQRYRGYVFTGNLGLSKKVGLRTKRRILFYNGDIECRLLEYELYEGSRKHHEPVSA